MSEEKPYGQYRCFVDGFEGGACIFDERPQRVNDCGIASTLHANGEGRNDCPHWLPTPSDELASLRARVARLEEVLKRGVELHENCDADTCMCGDSMWHPPAGHKPTSMLQYYGDQWAEEARRALEEK